MKNVTILVPENSVMQSIADPQYCFTAANQFLAVSGKKSLFNVELVGLKKEIFINNYYCPIKIQNYRIVFSKVNRIV